jgi:ABC-type transport system involved in cytochrome bd biosynthesis fused ATPase/permease subunit
MTPSEPTYRVSARALGVGNVLLSFVLAVASALALAKLAHGSTSTGLVLLSIVLAGRWLIAAALVEWSTATSRSIKGFWRRRLIAHLRQPRAEGERSRGDLSLAIDHASDGPWLELLATSARVSVLGLGVVFWAVGWLSTLITLALMGLAVPLYQRAGRRSEALAQDYQQRRALLETRQLELLNHAPELRALGAVAYGADEIAAISTSEHAIAMRAIRVALESSLVTEFLSGVSIGLVAMVVGFRLLEGHLSLEHALIAILVTSEIFVNVRRFGVEFHRRENAQQSLALLDLPASLPATTSQALLRAKDLVTQSGPTTYDFSVAAGDRVLVTGPSGAGKTTLLHTLLGWREAVSGHADHTEGVIGYVSVESALLAGTLYENLSLGRSIDHETIQSLLESLDLTGARFSDLSTSLLADGRGLSTGEKVRLALARCVLAEPSLLVLDDIAGVVDEHARGSIRALLDSLIDVAVVEATVDTPLLDTANKRIEVPG